MNLNHLFESDEPENAHFDALDKTGYYGKQGAGCLFLARSTGRLLLALRSKHVEQPGTWGVIGGAIDGTEKPADAAKREASEEAGFDHPVELLPIFVYRDQGFQYSNFLAVVDDEFEAHDQMRKGFRETDAFRWVDFGHWPNPLHFGAKAILADQASVRLIKSLITSD